MTRDEKFQALIKKALENGWPKEKFVDIGADILMGGTGLRDLLFNHDFARALFNDDSRAINEAMTKAFKEGRKSTGRILLDWQHHLQQAVISEDPIDYMYQEVFNGRH